MTNVEQDLRDAAAKFATALETATFNGYRCDILIKPESLRSIAISETSAVKHDKPEPAPTLKKPGAVSSKE